MLKELLAKEDGVIIHPTDTCYGLACRIDRPLAIKSIYEMKGRNPTQPSSILVSDLPMLERYALLSPYQRRIITTYSPERLTYILPLKKGNVLPEEVHHKDTISIRIPKKKSLRKLIQSVGTPLMTTSVNKGGEREATSESEILIFLHNTIHKPELVLLASTLQKTKPSTIIRVTHDSYDIVRHGSFPL